MQSQKYEFQSEFARKHIAIGEARGEAIGEARGEARGEAKAILAVLDARGVAVSPTQHDRILACTDLATLERWVRRAVTVASADELLG